MIVSPPNGGFPLVNETRGTGESFFLPAGTRTAEDGSPGFEKMFAEFLAGLNRREEGEREAVRAREEAGAQTGKARETAAPGEAGTRETEAEAPREAGIVRESGALRKTESPGEAEAPHGTGVPAEAAVPRENETPEEAGSPGDLEISWEIAAQGDAGPAPARFDEAPEGEFRENSPEFSPGELRPAEDSGLLVSALRGRDGAEAAGTRGEFPPAGPAEGRPGEGETLVRGEKLSSAAKGGGIKKGAGEKTAGGGTAGEESPVLREIPDAPAESAAPEEPTVPGEPAEVRGAARTAPSAAGEKAGGLESPPAGEGWGPSVSVLALGTAEQGAGKPREVLGREDRESGRRKVELRDRRGRAPREGGSASGSPGQPAGQSPAPGGPSSGRSPGLPSPASAPELSAGTLSRDSPQADLNAPHAGAAGGAFEEVLARELRQNLNSDIVRHAQVILRKGGEGTIRLALRPESLGHVKIRLELTENRIAGRIIVESGEALRAFEREIASLEQAFRDSGYESADLLLSQDGSGGGREEGKPFYSPRFAAERARYDEILERTDASFSGFSENGLGPGNGHIQVNMLI